ncbi:PEP-CTERM sorting domain-containing protein [Bowmanella pacifica]|nr:PEP-CTERM sorting domain-containing protein [Bowmanella pacifica]
MKKIMFLLSVIMLASQAHAALLTFDNIPGGSEQNRVDGMPVYEGFVFSSTLDWIDVEKSGWNFGAYSGDFALLNNYGGVGIVTQQNGDYFTFDGLWAKRWSTGKDSGGADSLFGTLQGYKDGVLAWSINTGLNGSYEYFGAQSGLIDELRLDFGNFFLVDNLALNHGTSTPVPEPAPLALLALGLAGIGLLRRRKSA